MEFTIKDNLRFLVETQSNYTNTVMYDDYGNPNIMVRLDKITYDDVDFGHFRDDHQGYVHGAFKLEDGKEVNEIWVSKYINSYGNGGVPISIPNALPMVDKSAVTAREVSFKKGRGWHMMTNVEWTAIMFYCFAMDLWPHISPTGGLNSISPYNKVKEGPGDVIWPYAGNCTMWSSHTQSVEGIYDLVGALWQWVDGFKMDKFGQGGLRFFGEDGIPMNLFTSNKYTTYGLMHFDTPAEGTSDTHWFIDVDDGYGGKSINGTYDDYQQVRSSVWKSSYPQYGYSDEDKTHRVLSELGILMPKFAKHSPSGNILVPGIKDDYSIPKSAARGGRMYKNKFQLKMKSTLRDLSFNENEQSVLPLCGFRTCYIDLG